MNSETYWTRIETPGKFESEPVLCRYLWKKTTDGSYPEISFPDGSLYIVVEVSEAERKRWALSSDVTALILTESDNGFVSMVSVNQSDIEKLEADSAEAWEAEDNS